MVDAFSFLRTSYLPASSSLTFLVHSFIHQFLDSVKMNETYLMNGDIFIFQHPGVWGLHAVLACSELIYDIGQIENP